MSSALFLTSRAAAALEIPQPGPDSQVRSDVPHGEVTKRSFASSQIFPGTVRDYWVYVPKPSGQIVWDQPFNLLVFQDGGGFVKADGAARATVVLDNLIAKGDVPPTVAVFVNPGSIPAGKPGAAIRSNRSFEYDSLGDRYVRFLLEELLPEALEGINITTDPTGRGLVGGSSGGICAFTAAWERPDQFGRVLSSIGSFTNIRGGYVYPALVRKSKTAPKPLRVWMQEGESDVDNLFGHWPLSNLDMDAALAFAGYEHQLVMTGGGHSGQASGALLPDALRWLFAPAKKPSNP
ncbi:MAG: esterase family protein [Verrucomicrobia bacterium]|nr:esterase family protein [Verrucomicrobiota bacterium]